MLAATYAILEVMENIYPAPYRKKNKWGYVNDKYQIIIPCVFGKAEPFFEGLAAVRENNWNFIDTFGTLLNSNEYYQVGNFSCELASFRGKSKTKFGFLNKSGKETIPEQFDCVFHFVYDFCLVSKDLKWGIIDRDGDFIIPCKFEGIADNPSQTVRWYTEFPKWEELRFKTVNPNFELFYLKQIKNKVEGLIPDIKNGKFGFVDEFGHTEIKYDFEFASNFKCERALIKLDGKFGYVDEEGELIIPNTFENANDFSENFAVVKGNDGMYGYIDIDGDLLTNFKYKSAEKFINGIASVKTVDGFWAYIDTKGKELWEI